jgi:alanyl aminopeptidase
MPWWDDIWLNEAFATWMGNRVVDEVHPSYHALLGALASVQHAMEVDSQAAARQIRQPIETDEEIAGAFDAITYSKGGAVLSMFERYLGAETFRAGLRLYMQRHRFGSATAADLVQSLAEASARPEVRSAFFSFLEQPGVPLVSADVSCGVDPPELSLRQSRYLPLGSQASAEARWELPVCVRFGGAQAGAAGEQCVLLKDAELRVPLATKGCPAWLMPNAGAQGYYRWSLSPERQAALLAALPQLGAAEQISFASAVLASMRAGTTPADLGLAALEKLALHAQGRGPAEAARGPARARSEEAGSTRQVLEAALSAFAVVEDDLLGEASLPAYRAKLAALLAPTYRRLGLLASPGEDMDRALERALVVRTLALSARDPALDAQLAEFGRAELGLGPAREPHETARGSAREPHETARGSAREQTKGTLANELRDEALTVALRADPRALLEPAIARLLASEDAQERSRLLSAVVALDDPASAARVLALGLEPRLRTNERLSPLYGQAGQPPTRASALSWLEQNFEPFLAQLGGNARPHVFGVLGQLCTASEIASARAFFAPRAEAVPGAGREFALALESAALCQAFRGAQADAARRYFHAK